MSTLRERCEALVVNFTARGEQSQDLRDAAILLTAMLHEDDLRAELAEAKRRLSADIEHLLELLEKADL